MPLEAHEPEFVQTVRRYARRGPHHGLSTMLVGWFDATVMTTA